MKISTKLFTLFFVLGIITSCKKDNSSSLDFRNKFIGQYQCVEKINSYGASQCGTSYSFEKDTVISVSYGATDSTLNVLGRDVYLSSEGYFNDYHYGLRLWNDSISSYYMNGGIGCGQNETYIGYKISSQP